MPLFRKKKTPNKKNLNKSGKKGKGEEIDKMCIAGKINQTKALGRKKIHLDKEHWKRDKGTGKKTGYTH